MLTKLHSRDHKKKHVHTIKKMNHNENHQIENTKHIDNGGHPVWVMSLGPGVKSGEASSLNIANDDDVHGTLFVITRMVTLNQSCMYLHQKFLRTPTHMGIPST